MVQVGPFARESVTLIGLRLPVDCRNVPWSSASVRVTLWSTASIVQMNSPGSTSSGTVAEMTCSPVPGVGGSGSGSGSGSPLSVPYTTVMALAAFVGSNESPLEYQNDARPVLPWKVTNDCGNAPTKAFVVFCGEAPAGGVIRMPA